jgi:hypothetical protein
LAKGAAAITIAFSFFMITFLAIHIFYSWGLILIWFYNTDTYVLELRKTMHKESTTFDLNYILNYLIIL